MQTSDEFFRFSYDQDLISKDPGFDMFNPDVSIHSNKFFKDPKNMSMRINAVGMIAQGAIDRTDRTAAWRDAQMKDKNNPKRSNFIKVPEWARGSGRMNKFQNTESLTKIKEKLVTQRNLERAFKLKKRIERDGADPLISAEDKQFMRRWTADMEPSDAYEMGVMNFINPFVAAGGYAKLKY